MRYLTILGHLRHLSKLQGLRHLQFHTCRSNPQTWNYFQFLKVTREAWNAPRAGPAIKAQSEQVNSTVLAHSFTPEAPQSKFFDVTSQKVAKNRLYSTCSDKPPNPPKKPNSCGPIDCTPKAKKPEPACPPKPSGCGPKPPACPPKPPACPPKPDCPPKPPVCPPKPDCPPKPPACPPKPDCPPKPPACPPKPSTCAAKPPEKIPCPPKVTPEENKNCPDLRDKASCSINKPQCPPKCEQPPKPKPCPPQPAKPSCSKPPPKTSGCGGGQNPPPCSRSFSSCAESSTKKPDLTVGQQQRNKMQEFCSKKKANGKTANDKPGETDEKPSESFEERIKREKEEMIACLDKKTEFSGLSYTRIHCKDCVRDVISKDVRRFFRELDPYIRVFNKKNLKKKSEDDKRHWLELLLTQ